MRLTPEEYRHVVDAWKDARESLQRDSWERMRIGAAIGIQPWVKKKVTAQELVPLPWDDNREGRRESSRSGECRAVSKEEALERFKELTIDN